MQAGDALRTSVLLVDDQPFDLAALERHLEPFELHLVKACSGEQALQHLEEADFALILMDVRMPGLDGFETAQRLHEQDPERRIPLIFLSGTPRDEAAIERAYSTGGVDYLRKPVDPRALRAKVRLFVDLYRERAALRAEQQAAESQRERLMAELREAVRLRDEFLAVASHELKTPLTPLSLRLQRLWQEVEALPPSAAAARLRKHLEAADGQVQRLTGLVDSLLDTTRITSGRLSLRRQQDVNLAAIVRAVAAGFEVQAARAGSPLEIDAPGRVLGHWDGLRLEQVVMNLVSNALKFGAGRTVHLRVEELEGRARLTVRDEGIGMDASVRARLFGRFERGVSEWHYGGLGLGLFITRQVVEALGGCVTVHSEPGQGATFTVELPCAPPSSVPGGSGHEE